MVYYKHLASLGVLFSVLLLCDFFTWTESLECQYFTADRGVITTPNFPNKYPVPLRACYVLARNPRDRTQEKWKTVIYFTQYLLTSGVSIEGYTRFEGLNSPLNEGRVLSSQPVATERPTELVIDTASYVAILVNVEHVIGANIRVPTNLLDVYGFNITYEFIPYKQATRLELVEKSEDVDSDVADKCLLDQCRYNGWCRANHNLSAYSCDCFDGFYGYTCQYSRRCNQEVRGSCVHGTCAHHIGSLTSICLCPRNYEPPLCERSKRPSTCAERRCTSEQTPFCTDDTSQNSTRCQCESGSYLRGCSCETGWKTDSNGKCQRVSVEWFQWHIESVSDPNEIRDKLLKMEYVVNATVLEATPDITRYQITIVRSHIAELMAQLGDFNFVKSEVTPEDDLLITSLVSNKIMPVQEHIEPLVLSCEFRAPEGYKVEWYKESALINTDFGASNLWQEHNPGGNDGLYTSYLGLDHVKYVDRGNFSCVVRHGDEVRRRTFEIRIKMEPSLSISPSSQNVEMGKTVIFTCGLRQYYPTENIQFKWFKSYPKDYSSEGRVWQEVNFKGNMLDQEFAENLFPTRTRLVIPSVNAHAEYRCQVDLPSGQTRKTVYVFPFSNTSAFCPAGRYMGISWNRTVVGAQDVKACRLQQKSPKGEAIRKCIMNPNGKAVWSEPNFFECAFAEIYDIRKEVLSLARGYQLTTAKKSLERLLEYIKSRGSNLLPGEGNHIMETLHEVLDYDEGLQNSHHEIKERNDSIHLFLECVSLTLIAPRSIQNHQFYEKLNEMIPNYVTRYLSNEPQGTEFYYENDLFGINARVFNAVTPDEDSISIFETGLPNLGVTGYTTKTHDSPASSKIILTLFVFKSLAKEYLSRMEWLEQNGTYKLFSRLTNLKVAAISSQGSMLSTSDYSVYVNYKLPAIANTSVQCARIVNHSEEIQFNGNEVTQVDAEEFSCEAKGSNLYALYRRQQSSVKTEETSESRLLPINCAVAGVFLSFSGVLTMTCNSSCWNIFKCVKLHVCIALTLNFLIALLEASSQTLWEKFPLEIRFLRQSTLLVVFGQQIVVLVTLFTELFEKRFFKSKYQIRRAVAVPWMASAIIMGFAFTAETYSGTNSNSYWGTMEATASLSSAIFTMMVIVSVATYGLIAFEIEMSTDREKNVFMTISQKGIMKRSFTVVAVLLIHSLAVTGYFDDPVAQAMTSILMALTVFFVYTAYCETETIYQNILAHYKKSHEVKNVNE